MGKRYYWLKLKDDFFRQLPMKKLRRIAGGDTYTIIYLKMMLVTTKTDGVLGYECSEEEFVENLALDIDEDEQNVAVTIQFLKANGLMVPLENGDMLLPEAKAAVGSEQASAQRVREFRAREKAKALQCNTNVTEVKQIGNGEIEKEKEIEKEIDTTNVVLSKDSSIASSSREYNEYQAYESIIGLPISQYLAEQLRGLFFEVGQYCYDKALKKAAEMNKRNFRYIETVARELAAGNDFDEKPRSGGLDFEAALRNIKD